MGIIVSIRQFATRRVIQAALAKSITGMIPLSGD